MSRRITKSLRAKIARYVRKGKGAKMENIDKIESLCKALRCIASKNSNGECYEDIHKNMLCIKNNVGEYSACPYFQDTYSINNLSWLSEVADILEGKSEIIIRCDECAYRDSNGDC